MTVGKDRSHARFLEEEPVEVEGPQGSWEGSNLWSFPPIFPPCSNSRGTFEPVEFRVWLRLVDNFQWTTPRRHHVADSPGVTRPGDAIISLLFTTARYVDVPMEKPRGRLRVDLGRICSLYSKKIILCAQLPLLVPFYLVLGKRRQILEEAGTTGRLVGIPRRAPWENGYEERLFLLRVTRESVDRRKLLEGGVVEETGWVANKGGEKIVRISGGNNLGGIFESLKRRLIFGDSICNLWRTRRLFTLQWIKISLQME